MAFHRTVKHASLELLVVLSIMCQWVKAAIINTFIITFRAVTILFVLVSVMGVPAVCAETL